MNIITANSLHKFYLVLSQNFLLK